MDITKYIDLGVGAVVALAIIAAIVAIVKFTFKDALEIFRDFTTALTDLKGCVEGIQEASEKNTDVTKEVLEFMKNLNGGLRAAYEEAAAGNHPIYIPENRKRARK